MAISKWQQKKCAAAGAEKVRSARPVVWIWALAAALLVLFLASFLIGRYGVPVPDTLRILGYRAAALVERGLVRCSGGR